MNVLSALAIPILMIVLLLVVIIVWSLTGPLIAMIALALVASAGVKVIADLRRRERMSDH